MERFRKGSKTIPAFLLVFYLVALPVSQAQDFHSPEPGTEFLLTEPISAYDRSRTGVLPSLFAKKMTAPTGQIYVILERYHSKTIFSDEIWLRITPIDENRPDPPASYWVKIFDDGEIENNVLYSSINVGVNP